MENFWQKLEKGFLVLAPMAGISDGPFRRICKEYGADVLYSEMASATALVYSPQKTLELLAFSEAERPYVAQLFGSKYQDFAQASRIVSEKIKPDGIDINFGCPVRKVLKQGAGSALFSNLEQSYSVIKAVIDNTDLPVSIKVRTEANGVHLFDFLKKIKDLDIKALMIHGRSLKQGFSGKADWSIAKEARNYFSGKIIINGSINSKNDYGQAMKDSQADGAALARGVLGRPWLFTEIKNRLNFNQADIVKVAMKHSELANEVKGEKGIIEMRKHLCWYVQGFSGAKKIRQELIKVKNISEIKKILNS